MDCYLAGESPLAVAGLHVSVLNAQNEVVADRTLDAATSETCFTDLPATTYRVLANLPIGYLATQQHRWSISLPSDAIVTVPFGVQLDPAAQSRFPIEWVVILAGLLARRRVDWPGDLAAPPAALYLDVTADPSPTVLPVYPRASHARKMVYNCG